MAEFSRLPTQEELSRMLYQMQLGNRSQQDIINENLAKGSTVKPIPDNIFQKMAGGAQTAKEQVNRLGNASDIAKLFPGYTGQSQVTIPTGYNFAAKQDPSGGVVPAGMQTQQINIDQLLKAIKPADVLGITGAQQAYSDVGMGKAPKPMDVLDIAGLGIAGLGAGKGLLEVAKATKGLPVGMSIKDVSGDTIRIYRGSFDNSPSYKVTDNFQGEDVYGGVFGSGNLSTAKTFGDESVHFTDIPKDKVLTQYKLSYEIPFEDTKKALLKAMPNLDKKYFDDVYNVIVNDVGQDLSKIPKDVIFKGIGKSDFGEANNEVQRIRGQVAKNLGFKAIEMGDETGKSYLVTPGSEFTKIEKEVNILPEYSENIDISNFAQPTGISKRKRNTVK